MATSTIRTSPHLYARIGGILYLLIIVGGILLPILVSVPLVVPGNAVSTAQNIIASPSLWRIGITGDIVIHVLDIPLMVVLYVLLKPINKSLAYLAVLFNLIVAHWHYWRHSDPCARYTSHGGPVCTA